MPCYVFECAGREHSGERIFEKFIHEVPKLVITQTECECGAVAKRRLDREIPTQAVVGLTPISHSTTTKGSVQHEIKLAFGEVQKNPDGSVDPNHTAFRDTGELNRFLNGQNDLGPRALDQRTGQPLRRKDGTYVHSGAKIIKYDKGAAPSKTGVRTSKPRFKNVAWENPKSVGAFPNTNSRTLKD